MVVLQSCNFAMAHVTTDLEHQKI